MKPLTLLAALVLLDSSVARVAIGDGVKNTDSQLAFTLPFKVIDNRVFVDVRLNGKGPFHFILDTGAEADLSDRAARQLGLKVKGAGEGRNSPNFSWEDSD